MKEYWESKKKVREDKDTWDEATTLEETLIRLFNEGKFNHPTIKSLASTPLRKRVEEIYMKWRNRNENKEKETGTS